MDSEFGQLFLFLTNLAWKSRITLPVLVTAVFMVMDIRLQIEINIRAGQLEAAEVDGINDGSDASDDSWETLDSDENDDDNSDYEGIEGNLIQNSTN